MQNGVAAKRTMRGGTMSHLAEQVGEPKARALRVALDLAPKAVAALTALTTTVPRWFRIRKGDDAIVPPSFESSSSG